MEKEKYKCETVNGKGCKTCGYKKLLLKEDNYFCRVCTRQDKKQCPLTNKKAPRDNCKTCSWRGIKEVNIINTEKKLKLNLQMKKDPVLKAKVERLNNLIEQEKKEAMAKIGNSGYDNKGLYNGYDKTHKDREALDYYATPPWEVKNILNELRLNFKDSDIILDNSMGGGHMLNGIISYLDDNGMHPYIIGTDIKDRNLKLYKDYDRIKLGYGEEYDYFGDKYPNYNPDYVIMNPPFNSAEGFILKSLREVRKGVLCFARLQLLEGTSRYKNIFKQYPPNYVYVYINRIQCYKNGDFGITGSSAQAYAWFYWEKGNKEETIVRWISRDEKGDIKDWE